MFAYRSQGLSQRGIAELMGLTQTQVKNDLEWGYKEWGSDPANSKEAIRGEITEILRRAIALTLQDAEKQISEGVTITTTDGRGQVMQRQTKQQLDPRTIAELGRTCERMGKMIGLDAGIDSGGAQAAVQVVLPSPSAAAFMATEGEAVTVTAESPPEAPERALEGSDGHSSSPEPSEALA